MAQPVWWIGAGSNQAGKKNILQVNTEAKYRFTATGSDSGKVQQQTSFFFMVISHGMVLLQPMYHSVCEAKTLHLKQPWLMVFQWWLEGLGADYMCTLGGGTSGSPSGMSAAHEQDTALTGLAIMSTYEEEHHGSLQRSFWNSRRRQCSTHIPVARSPWWLFFPCFHIPRQVF